MNGAKEYATMFSTGQYGRLYLSSHCHARGKTFHIYVLPKGESAFPNGPHRRLNKNAVEVYGITGGNPGWTETYGWLYRGKWEQDFAALVEARRAEIDAELALREREKYQAQADEDARRGALLADY